MAARYPCGYRWRSSNAFIIFTAVLGLFSEVFLYGFIVPILPYMIETRVHLPPSKTQRITTALLTTHGLVSIISGPIIAHFADKAPSRRTPLLLSLVGCIIGTLFMSFASSVWELFLGRIIQAAAASAGWIISFATLADNVASEHIGKILGMAMSFVAAGITTGPMVSGALLQLAGYWATWLAPLILLSIDIIARLAMIEYKDPQTKGTPAERAPLTSSMNTDSAQSDQSDLRSPGFYRTMFTDIRVIVGLLNTVMFSAILSSFDTTLPLHLQEIFGWGSLPVGMVFLGLQMPGLFLSPLIGWLRDYMGLKYPTALGWSLIAVLLWLVGIPGLEGVQWANPETNGKIVFVGGIIGIGSLTPLVRDAGIFQLTAVTNQLQSDHPGIFGDHGGHSRSFSIHDIVFNVGTMVGPLLAGALTEVLGFYYLTCTLAVLCLSCGLLSFVFFARKTTNSEY